VSNPVADALFATARATPDDPALRDDLGALTYAEVDALAGTFARILLERCARDAHAARPVPILVDRDRWSIVAVLGAIRAGVPHVPLDRNLPTAALAGILARLGGPDRVLVHPETVATLPAGTVRITTGLTVDDPVAPRPVAGEDVASVMFTSGSTGRPKGVVFEWRNLAWLFESTRDTDWRRRMLSVPLHWLGGTTGACRIAAGHRLSILPSRLRDPVEVLEWMDREELDSIAVPPTLVMQLAGRWPAGRRLERVGEIAVFGDRLSWDVVPPVRRLGAPTAVIRSHYGATEAGGVAVCILEIGPDDEVGTGPIPLGRRLEPGRGRLEPLDDGDGLAEIVVTGKVARGYWDDPTEEVTRFGRDPDGTPTLRTGDLARVDEHGLIHLVGRADDLVKIRGIRVEPAETEAALTAFPGIRAAVALPHEGPRGTRLVGHLVLDDATLTPESVRTTLGERLPPHLIPSPLVVHDALPLLPNGKIDRLTLRSRPLEPWRTTTPRPPRDDLEADVATLCAEVLELDDVGPDEDLWTRGLDSLRALELAAAVSELGWGPFDPSAPLRHVTAAAIADWLRTAAATDDPHLPSAVIPLHPAPSGPGPGPTPVVAVPGAGGTATAFFWLARALGPDRPLTVIEAHGLHTPGAPDRTVAAAAHRAADLVAGTHPDGPLVLLGHSAGGAVAYETAVLLHTAGRTVRVAILDTPLPALAGAPTTDRAAAPTAAATPSRRLRPSLRRIPRRALDEARIRLRARHPGPPSRSLTRFRAFTRIGERALRDYRPTPVPVPTLVLHVDDRVRDAWTGAVPDLTFAPLPGEHRSLLRPPHVQTVADHVRALAGALDPA
jgi:acyl-CoA synthetase (AMP-forming)/AMP-acid ligase II/thioesterase domain-containing protein